MANVLGSLQVELTANTAKFVGELGKAAVLAQQSAKNISREFSSLQRVASQTFGAFGSLNPAVSQVSFALSAMGSAAASAMKEFGSTKTALGSITSIAAGAAAGLAAAAAATVAVAVRAADAAAKLHELSQSTGVSTEALSGLGFAAKQVGVEQETLVKGLEKMSKSAFAAATAPLGAINAFTRLGVSVRDASGNIRTTEAIFADLAGKFAAMPDGIAKTALEMEIFGRNGAAMAPLLDLGKNGIDGMIASATRFGVVVSSETAEAAERFKQKLGELTGIADGFSLSLMQNMLPLLNATASSFENSAEGLNSWARAIGQLARGILIPLDAVFTGVNQAAIAFVEWQAQIVYGFSAIGTAAKDLATGNLKDLADLPARYSKTAIASIQDSIQSSKKEWSSLIDFINNTSPDNRTGWMEPLHHHGRADTDAKNKGVGAGAPEKDFVGEAVGKLQAEAAAQLALAGATDRTTAAMLFQKAASEAEQKVAEIRTGLLTEEKSLQEQLANARASDGGKGEAAKIDARIAGVHKELAALDAAAPLFTKLYAQIAAAKASSSASGELQKKSDDFERQITSLRELAASYGKGGAAVAAAEIDKQLEGEKEKLDDMREEYARLASTPGNGVVSSEQGQGPSPALFDMAAAVDTQAALIEKLKSQAETTRGLNFDVEIGKLNAELRGAAPLLDDLNHAYLENETAVRKAQVALELYRWTQAHPGASPDQIRAEGEALKTQSDQAHASAIAQEADQYDLVASYNNRIQKLEQIRELIQSEGQSTLLVDAAIYDEQRKQLEQWDQAAIKVGTFGEQMHAVLNQVALDAENAGGKIAESMDKAIGGVEDNIAKLIVTGKSNFKSMFEGFAESMIKIQLQSAAGSIEKAIGIKIPGLEGKRGDSAGNPLYVQDVSPGGGNLPLGPGFGSGRTLPSILNLGKPGTGTTPPFVGESSAAPGSAPPTFVARLLSSFGIKTSAAAGMGTSTKPAGSSSDPIYVLTAPAGAAVSGEGPGSSFGLGDQGIFDATSSMHLRPSSILENLPLGPGFGSGLPSTNLTSLSSPGDDTDSGAGSGGGFLSSVLGIGGPGGGKKPTGSSNDPLYVKNSGSSSSGAGGLTSMFSGLGGSGGSSDGGDSGSGSGGGSGGTLQAIMGFAQIFAGFMASGGDAEHGHAYIVGEKGPELFKPDVSGTIIPSFSLMKRPKGGDQLGNMSRAFGGFRAAGGDVMPGRAYAVGEKHPEVFMPDAARGSAPSPSGNGMRQTIVHFSVNGVRDHDSFERSQSQIYSGLHAAMELAKARE